VPNHPYSPLELEERAADARELLGHPLLLEATTELHHQYVAMLIQSELGSPQALMAQAGLKSIQHMRGQLESVITEQKMDKKNRERGNQEKNVNGR
jgi:hypothetical protein